MAKKLGFIGAPSSAGAYAPGQELAPEALRGAGFLELLEEKGVAVEDLGDIEKFRCRADPENIRATNIEAVVRASKQTAEKVARANDNGLLAFVCGGDCTLQFGSVSGLLASTRNVGLLYIDLDPDMQTPHSTWEGAPDYMGVAHMLDIPGVVQKFSRSGPREPLLPPEAIRLFMIDNATPSELGHIGALGIACDYLPDILPDPEAAGIHAAKWGAQFDVLSVHLDIDVLNFGLLPLAENTRKKGTTIDVLVKALRGVLTADNLAVFTLTEVNPQHGAEDGSTMRVLAEALADVFSEAACLK